MNKIENIIRFYYLATDLKYSIRSAWDDKHWGILGERRESIAEHVYGVSILAISICSEFDLDVDLAKVIKMLTIHEIGEVLIGDYTPFDNMPEEQKLKIEHKAIKEVIGDLKDKDELFSLLLEFDKRETNEAKFAYLCDKLELNLQAKAYQDKGLQKGLDNQEGNVVMGFSSIIKIIEKGAQNAFDVFYENDIPKFENNPVFKEIIDFVRDNNVDVTEKKEDLRKKIGVVNRD